ncbi:MAG: TIGR03560 family F420-dependent LLM class oxidoreductase [Anaerolineales bacterium]|nr:TIGR03560 family F420-dependent LLM class oxidoreductase [Anaerolineales bacterium]
MKFGIHSPSFIYNEPNIFDGIKKKVIWIEEHGFDWFSVMDHMIQIPVHGLPEEPFMESWTLLSALAVVTTRIRLSTLVTSTSYRNPALLAKMVANLDLISKGRITLGIGAGWYEDEYKQYGFDFSQQPAERVYRLEDAVKLIKEMWTQERATYRGKYFHIENAILEPKPIQKPHPPILIGGAGEQLTLRTVARVGNMCNFIGSPDEVKKKFEVLNQHCVKEGRDYNEIERTILCNILVAKDESTLKSKLEKATLFKGRGLTIETAKELFNQYQSAGVQMLICSIYQNDEETLEVLSEIKELFK